MTPKRLASQELRPDKGLGKTGNTRVNPATFNAVTEDVLSRQHTVTVPYVNHPKIDAELDRAKTGRLSPL